jgi:hypothetical protein
MINKLKPKKNYIKYTRNGIVTFKYVVDKNTYIKPIPKVKKDE